MSRSKTLARLLSVSTALTFALLGAGCSSNTNPTPAEAVASTHDALTASSYTFVLPLPTTTGLDRVALAATGTLNVDDRAQVTSGSGFAEVVNTGAAATTLGADSQVGTVTSVAPLTLRDRARVNGDATSGGVITPGVGSTITGVTAQNRSIAVDRLTFTVNFPASGADLDVTSGRTTLAPSSRGNVHVLANTTLALSTGTYYFDQLTVEPQGALALDTQAGPVYVYVRTGLTYRGTTSFTGPNDRFLVGYAGSLAPALDKPLGGTLLAPSASVRLGVGGSPYAGAVFAQSIELDPDVRFAFRGFSGFGQVPFDVIPTLTCVEQRPDQSFAALFGYYNPNANPATVPVGANNGFSPNPQNHGQLTTFLAGRHTSSFSADFGSAQTLTYKLGSTTLTVPRTAARCASTSNVSVFEDTTVAQATPFANFGSSTRLSIGPTQDALIRVDRPTLKQLLGAGRFVAKASLELHWAAGGKPAAQAFVANHHWTERGATFSCVNDTDPSAGTETCAVSDHWQLTPDLTSNRNPWRRRAANRRVLGAWSGNTLKFDVTRDVQNLAGSEGLTREMSWVVIGSNATDAPADFFSRESGQGATLVLTLSTRPEVDPAGSTPLAAVVDTTVAPKPASTREIDGSTVTVAAVVDPHGLQSNFVDSELLYFVQDLSELTPVLNRFGGRIARTVPPPVRMPSFGTLAVVHIDATRAQASALVPRLLEIDNRPRGTHRFSSASALGTMAAAAEEALAGRRVRMNWVQQADLPSISDWSARTIADGAWDGVLPGPDLHGGLGSNGFFWPGYVDYVPDPVSTQVPPTNLNKWPDGTPMFQTLSVAEGWRSLALMGRLEPASIKAGLVDAGFNPGGGTFAPIDYPQFKISYDINEQGDIPGHGNTMAHVGYGVPGNGIGAAGPGGPVAALDLEAVPVTQVGTWAGYANTFDQFSRVASASRHSYLPAVATIFTGLDDQTQQMRDQGILLFGAAGNGVDNKGATPIDVDAEDCFIACWEEGEWEPCEDDGVECVTALDFNSYSRFNGANYGSEDVDLAAPWYALDALGDGTNRFMLIGGGTSSATAFTGGATTLVFAADPTPLDTPAGRERSADNVEHCIYAASNPVASGASGRYWNVLGAIKCMATGSTTGDLPGQLVIETPSDGSQVGWKSFVNVQALATDPESGLLTVQWSSDVDGPLAQSGSEQTGTAVFQTPGLQHLTATAFTSTGQVLTQTITVNVTPVPPEVAISQPANDGQIYPASLPVTFVATAAGFSGTFAPDSAFVWSSQAADGSQDFAGLVGRHIQPSFASVGDHVVTVVYTEEGTGATATATRRVHVVASTSLGVTITNPVLTSSGQARQQHDLPLTLMAQATASANYAWEVVTDKGTVSLGGGQSRSWDPATDTAASCFEQEVLLRVTATDGSGGVAVDAIPLVLYPSPQEVHDLGCVR